MYIKFDLTQVDHRPIQAWVETWCRARDIGHTSKILRNHRRQEYRVCFNDPDYYAFFFLAFPDHLPRFSVVGNGQMI